MVNGASEPKEAILFYGLTLIPWKKGKSLVREFTCPDSLAPSHLAPTSACGGAAAVEAVLKKRRKYAFLDGRFLLAPVAVETLGAWDLDGLRLGCEW